MKFPMMSKPSRSQLITQSVTLAVTLLTLTSAGSATYLGWKSDENRLHEKSNKISTSKRYGPVFKSDWDVSQYLKLYGLDMMLWRCKNAIQPYWDWKPIPVLELYCEAIGRLRNVTWQHNGKTLQIGYAGSHYGQIIKPHYSKGRWFAKWLDFRLRIYNATQRDSGIYTFKAIGARGTVEEQTIYVDISEKKKKKKKKRKRIEDRELRRKLRKERRQKLRLKFWKEKYRPL